MARSPIRRVERDILRDLTLPAIAIREQPLFIVIEFFPRFGREFEIRPLDDRVYGAGLLAKAAVYAFHHVDVVARRPPRAIVPPRARFDGDRLRGADRLTQLAGDAALLTVRIAAQRMFAPEARRNHAFFERIIQRRFGCEEIAHREEEPRDKFEEKKPARVEIEFHRFLTAVPGR